MGCKYLTTGLKGKARSITSRAGDAPVGRLAIPGKPNRKMAQRLEARRRDYEAMMQKGGWEQGTKKRMSSGGYHKPGAFK